MKKILMILLIPICLLTTSSEALCESNCNTLSCKLIKFRTLKKSNYDSIEKTYFNAEMKALKCKDVKDVADLLNAENEIKRYATLSEDFSEIIEKEMLLENQICLFNALLITDKKAMEDIISDLKEPMFIDKSEAEKVFLKYKNHKKYKTIMKLYFLRK